MTRLANLCLVTAVLTAAPAAAQFKPETHTGSMIPVAPHALQEKDAGAVRKRFAECLYRADKSKVAALLAHSDARTVDLDGARIKNVRTELGMEDCLGDEMMPSELTLGLRFAPDSLRDLMAEETYLTNHRTAPVLASDAKPLTPTILPADLQPATTSAVAEFGDCTVRADTADADKLLRTMPGSDNERLAAAALAPALGKCLTGGQTIAFSPGNIRALIAYAMWSRFDRGGAQ